MDMNVITVPAVAGDFEYTLGSGDLTINNPTEFSSSLEDVCGSLNIVLLDDYDHSIVSVGAGTALVNSTDATLIGS